MRWFFALALLFQDADKAQVTLESSLELDIVVRDGSGETTRLLNLMRKEKFSQERVDVRTLRIRCLTSTLQKSGTDIPIEEKATALAGQTFTAVRGAEGWTVSDASGAAPPQEGRSLGAWNEVVRLLPAGAPPAAGAQWSVEGKELLSLIAPAVREGMGKLECTCESAADGKIQVVFTGSITGKGKEEPSGPVTLTIKSGRYIHDTTKNKPVSLMMSGGFESTTDMVDRVRKPNSNEEETRKVGEISVKSRKLEAFISFE